MTSTFPPRWRGRCAILDYLDVKPVEDLCAAGVLRAAARRKQSESESRSDLREE